MDAHFSEEANGRSFYEDADGRSFELGRSIFEDADGRSWMLMEGLFSKDGHGRSWTFGGRWVDDRWKLGGR